MSDSIAITFMPAELLIVRECVRLIADRASLHEVFEDEDFKATDGDPDAKRPTDVVERKLAIYCHPNDDASVLGAIKKENG